MIKNYLKTVGTFLFTGLFLCTNSYAQSSDTTFLFDGQVHLEPGKERVHVGIQEVIGEQFQSGMHDGFFNQNENILYNANLSEAILPGILKWRALPNESTIPEGWIPYQICDNNTCFSMNNPTSGWFYEEEFAVFDTIYRGAIAEFYTTMYIPEGTTENYGEIVIELAYDNATDVLFDTLTFGFLAVPLDLDELESQEIQVYPNPTTDIVKVNLKDNTRLSSVGVFDMQGRQIQMHKNIGNTEFTVNVANLAQGMYIIRIENEKGASAIQKIQKL
ncbi:MAG TPA: T9SS type A sorting domain-containing protein [Chitinophagaceae bacterium]|nr:T9SS type A sorting domain-containing protein [Chitinophagaceae bacterium]